VVYREGSLEARLLTGDLEAVGRVSRWIASVIAAPRFWILRDDWLDLHQETMARVIESLRQGRFDPGRDFRVYVQAVGRYTALQALGLRLHHQTAGAPDGAGPGTAETEVISIQVARLALERASDDCRGLIQSYFFEERGYAEIAAAMGVPVGTVKSRLFRCLESIHRAIGGGRAGRGTGSRS
jgi:RNA polymerase sigma-70 factor (ECF subfamily)